MVSLFSDHVLICDCMNCLVQAFDALLTSLDPRGAREAALTAILHRLEGTLRKAMKSKSFSSGQQCLTSSDRESAQSFERGSAAKGMNIF